MDLANEFLELLLAGPEDPDFERIASLGERATRQGRGLIQVLVEEGVRTEVEIASELAKQLGIPFRDPVEASPMAPALIPQHRAEALGCVALGLRSEGGESVLELGMVHPFDRTAADLVARSAGARVEPIALTGSTLEKLLDRAYPAPTWETMGLHQAGDPPEDRDPTPVRRCSPEALTDPVRNLGRLILQNSAGSRCRQVRLEPHPTGFHVRAEFPGGEWERVMRLPGREAYAAVLGTLAETLGIPGKAAPGEVPGETVVEVRRPLRRFRCRGDLLEFPRGEGLHLRLSPVETGGA